MSEERLQKIKDSIDFQKQTIFINGFDMNLIQEEIDLYDEVVRLNNILTEFEKWINLKIKQTKEYDTKNYHNDIKLIISTYQFALDKLQELKEGKK